MNNCYRRLQIIVALFIACGGARLSVTLADDAAAAELPPASTQTVDFVRDIQPIFAKHCLECHGAKMSEAGLRLDMKSRALDGGDSGVGIIPGDSAGSLLIQYVAGLDPDMVMPPEGDRLTKQQVGLLRGWIDQGAKWPASADAGKDAVEHWAYQPLERPEVPQVKHEAWVRNPIDAFVLAGLERVDVKPAPAADRQTLIRRLSLDLRGIPPTPAEVHAFLADRSAQAYDNLVEQMLDSPHFGERWGRHWLDKARYADSDGYEKDRPRPNAWRWRDWVIDAVNSDMPFDQFTIEQQAGDLLPNATDSQKLATAFHRQTLTNTEGGTDKEQFRVEAIFDRVETTGAVWLGLTVGCARCHSHKYDRISQREYYQFFAFLNNGDEVTTNVPKPAAIVARIAAEKKHHAEEVQRARAALAKAQLGLDAEIEKWLPTIRQPAEATSTTSAADTKPAATPPSSVPDAWEIVSVKSDGGVTFKKLEDGSYLAEGKNPATATYTVIAKTSSAPVTGFIIDVFADDALPARGPGRVKHGNFVLNEVDVFASANKNLKDAYPVGLTNARSDYAQGGFDPAKAIDGDASAKNGWAVGGEYGKSHQISFDTTRLAGTSTGESYLKFELKQVYGSQHTIGRFRILPTYELPGDIRTLAQSDFAKVEAAGKQRLRDYYSGIAAATQQQLKTLHALESRTFDSPEMTVRVIQERAKDPRETHILRRGDFLQPLGKVEPGVLATLQDIEARNPDSGPDRLDFARWLVSKKNPLTPRVVVNQMWGHLFGNGLVRTVNDFGVRGDKPTHPELLDWLSAEFIETLGWSRKGLIRLIVTSATYQQSSAHRPELAERDPENNWLARQNRFRVEAEIIRDISLAAAGLLSESVGGESAFPPMPADIAALSYANNFKWKTSARGVDDRYRRGMYTFFKRTAPHPNLTTFDCPDSNTTCVVRSSSNTPLQALTTLNNEVFVESSQMLAKRVLLSQVTGDDTGRLGEAFLVCLSRPPSSTETAAFLELLQVSRQWYAEHPEEALLAAGLSDENEAATKAATAEYKSAKIPVTEAAAWVATSRMIMNLDEFVTRE